MGGYLVAIGALVGVVAALVMTVAQPRSIPATRPSVLEVVAIMVLCAWAGMFLIGMLALPVVVNALGLAP